MEYKLAIIGSTFYTFASLSWTHISSYTYIYSYNGLFPNE